MTLESLQFFLPEIGLSIVACVVLVLGQGRGSAARGLVAPVTLVSLLAAMIYLRPPVEHVTGVWVANSPTVPR